MAQRPHDSILTTRRRWVVTFLSVFAVLALVGFFIFRHIAEHRTRQLFLADGTVILLHGRSTITPAATFPRTRTVQLDGAAVFQVTASADAPFLVTSRLLRLTVTAPSQFLVMADSKESGEQVQVMRGALTAEKNYPSTFKEPDRLQAGEMSMVNISIDLMEKEHFTRAELPDWATIESQSPPP